LPECLSISIEAGSPAYFKWLEESVE
jgi:uncharacterized protein involved in tolerance to divalent cations